jgi:AraC family transcriptional regulator, transcriptional activator of pobA
MASGIPHYALYGDQADLHWQSSFNFEWIPERSRMHQWEIRPHVHDAFVQILYITEGSGSVILGDARWPMKPPCLVVIPAQHVHGFHFSSDVNGPVVTAAQKPLESLAQTLMPELMQTIRTPVLLHLEAGQRHAGILTHLFEAIEREWRMHERGQAAAGMALLCALLVQIRRMASIHPPAQASAHSRKSRQIEKFRTMVDEGFRQHHPLAHYAQAMGISTGQLSRICRDMLGVPALGLLQARIIHEAQRDLVYTSASVKQIAASLGFLDEAYFGRFFRKHAGQSPREFREQARRRMSQTGNAGQ